MTCRRVRNIVTALAMFGVFATTAAAAFAAFTP